MAKRKPNKPLHQNRGKGKIIRPCHVCGDPVNFVLWESETILRGKRIFHWANTDGSHHHHSDRPESQLDADAMSHLRSI